MTTVEHDLIVVLGIGGEIAVYMSSKTVIYFAKKNVVSTIQFSKVLTVGRRDRDTDLMAK
jgi:hypothetical protein